MAPDGHSTIYVLVRSNVHESINWDEIKHDYRDVVLETMKKLGYDDLKEHMFKTIVTPDDWGERDIYKGAVFNLAHGLDQMLWRRPQNRFEEFDDLFLVGGGNIPEVDCPPYLRAKNKCQIDLFWFRNGTGLECRHLVSRSEEAKATDRTYGGRKLSVVWVLGAAGSRQYCLPTFEPLESRRKWKARRNLLHGSQIDDLDVLLLTKMTLQWSRLWRISWRSCV